jgi:hypothetical protein
MDMAAHEEETRGRDKGVGQSVLYFSQCAITGLVERNPDEA